MRSGSATLPQPGLSPIRSAAVTPDPKPHKTRTKRKPENHLALTRPAERFTFR